MEKLMHDYFHRLKLPSNVDLVDAWTIIFDYELFNCNANGDLNKQQTPSNYIFSYKVHAYSVQQLLP